MRRMRFLVTLSRGIEIDQNVTALYFDRIGRNTIVIEAWLALAATSVKFPVMPRADNIFAIQPAFAERSACVIAGIGKNTKCAVL